jgi:hypothetical protein
MSKGELKEYNLDLIKFKVDKQGTIYVGICGECGIKLTADEAYYGHDCES